MYCANIKKILVIGPMLPQWSDIIFIAESMKFMKSKFKLDFVDPLIDFIKEDSKENFFNNWNEKLKYLQNDYDGFIGFSLGGIILQQCFLSAKKLEKSLIIFSTPSACTGLLYERLSNVIQLINEKSILEAINLLNHYVFYPYVAPQHNEIEDTDSAKNRLLFGLKCVLETDSRLLINATRINYLHLIGENSELVNQNNVLASPFCQLVVVPNAGMRVLDDNLSYCIKAIMPFLNGEEGL